MKITFIGTGYVGLVSGVMMSELGHHVICLDPDKSKIAKLKQNLSPIFEENLERYIRKNSGHKLQFVDSYDESISDSDCVFITVGTPSTNSGAADLTGIFDSVKQVCKFLKPQCLIIIKSTVPPGTCNSVQKYIKDLGFDNEIVSNPEFLREGTAVRDFLEPDRIIAGVESEYALKVMNKIYEPITENDIKLVATDLVTAELIKYASNTFLANKIAFINEMSDLCEAVGADVLKLVDAVGLDKRIGREFLIPGPGFGGSCFPKDIIALQALSKSFNSDFLVLDAIIKSNKNRGGKMLDKIANAVGEPLRGKKIAVLGLTYKAGTDDLRNSPAIEVINGLELNGVTAVAYDPEGMSHAPKYFSNLKCVASPYEAALGTDALVIITEWPEFVDLDYSKIKDLMSVPVIIDLRNILNPEQMSKIGFSYHSVGRKSVG